MEAPRAGYPRNVLVRVTLMITRRNGKREALRPDLLIAAPGV